MATSFDPYREWLEIEDMPRPPTHYSILGVKQGESRADVIEKHAARQKQRLSQYLQGPNARLAKRLAYEIEAARSCLTDAERRAAYNRTLRAAQGKKQGARPVPLRPAGQPKADDPLDAPAGAPDVGTTEEILKSPTRASGKSVDRATRAGGAGHTSPAPPTLLLGRAHSAALSRRRFQRQMVIAAVVLVVTAAGGIGTATWLRPHPDRSATAEVPSEADPAALPPPPPPPPPPEAEQWPDDDAPDQQPPGDMVSDEQRPGDESPDEQPSGDVPLEPPLEEPAPRLPPTADSPPDPFAALPVAIDLPDGPDVALIGSLSAAENGRLRIDLLAPSIDDAPRFRLEERAVPDGLRAWRVLGVASDEQPPLHIATFRKNAGQLVFAWERQMQEMTGAGLLRNCVLHVASGDHQKVIALRTLQMAPALTVDLSKATEHVPIDGEALPPLRHLILKIDEPSGRRIGRTLRVTPNDRKVSGSGKIELVLLDHQTPPISIVWSIQMTAAGGRYGIRLATEMISASTAAPFTQKTVERMQHALPRTLAQLRTNLAQVEAEMNSIPARRNAISRRNLPPAVRQAALRQLQQDLETLDGQRNSILRQLQLNSLRLEVVPELSAVVSAFDRNLLVHGRVYFPVQEHRVEVLSFGNPSAMPVAQEDHSREGCAAVLGKGYFPTPRASNRATSCTSAGLLRGLLAPLWP